jgi:cytochrome c oxidase assembly protein subunit 15
MSEPASTAAGIDSSRGPGNRQIAWWLLICCALIFAMVVLGGVTRLTGSGLSMVNWKPIAGVLPPIGQVAWEREFEHYRQSPEYAYVNKGMSLGEFKGIFWFEYAHRLLGRLIGLGGLQGLLGWYMVKSGLVDDPHVSQYRLAAHLGLAILIYAYMLWTAVGILWGGQKVEAGGRNRLATITMALVVAVFVTMISGAFVAGLKAGMIYNTFPLMGDTWLPEAMWSVSPAWLNIFENAATVQFNHRLLAIATFLSIVALWLGAGRVSLTRSQRVWLHAVCIVAVVQVALGVSTLLLRVPVSLAALHQAGAMALLTVLLCLAYETRYCNESSGNGAPALSV